MSMRSSSTPPVSLSRSPSPSRNLTAELSQFHPERLRYLRKLRQTSTSGTPGKIYAELHPEADQSRILHFETLYGQKNKEDHLDSIDQILAEASHHNAHINEDQFDPERFFFRNTEVNSENRTFSYLTVDEQLFQDTGLDKSLKYCASSTKHVLKHINKIATGSGSKIKAPNPTEVLVLHNALQLSVKVGEACRWLAEEIIEIEENLLHNIKVDLREKYEEQCPAVRLFDTNDIQDKLLGLRSLAEKASYLSTQPEKLLSLYFQKDRTESELLAAVQKQQRCHPVVRKNYSWLRKDEIKKGVPTMKILKSFEKPVFVAKFRRKTEDSAGNRSNRYHSSRYRRKKRSSRKPKYQRSRSRQRESRSRSVRRTKRQHFSQSRSKSQNTRSKPNPRFSRSRSLKNFRSDSQRSRSFSSNRNNAAGKKVAEKPPKSGKGVICS